jgi:hypothetical protein
MPLAPLGKRLSSGPIEGLRPRLPSDISIPDGGVDAFRRVHEGSRELENQRFRSYPRFRSLQG